LGKDAYITFLKHENGNKYSTFAVPLIDFKSFGTLYKVVRQPIIFLSQAKLKKAKDLAAQF